MRAAVVEHVAVEEAVRAERRRILSRSSRTSTGSPNAAWPPCAPRSPPTARATRASSHDVRDQVRRTTAPSSPRCSRTAMSRSSDIAFVRAAATRRARAGFALEDYINAFRVGQQVFWEAVVEARRATPLGPGRR